MRRRPPRSTRTDTLFPYPTLFRSMQSAPAVVFLEQEYVHVSPGFSVPGELSPFVETRTGGSSQLESSSRIDAAGKGRTEEHTSELQSLMRTSYAVFCLQHKKNGQLPIPRNYFQLHKLQHTLE